MSPRKVRLVIDAVRGLPAMKAETRLQFIRKGAAEPVLKLLRSAMANAEHNNKLRKEDLMVKTITADGGPMIKRSRARAFGRAAPIRKRTTHITIVLGLKPGVTAPKNVEAVAEQTDVKKPVKAPAKRASAAKPKKVTASRKKTS